MTEYKLTYKIQWLGANSVAGRTIPTAPTDLAAHLYFFLYMGLIHLNWTFKLKCGTGTIEHVLAPPTKNLCIQWTDLTDSGDSISLNSSRVFRAYLS